MKFLKANLLDLLAVALVAFGLFREVQAITVILWIYLALSLLTRVVGFFVPSMVRRATSDNQTPVWFYHLLYGISIAILIYTNRIELGIAWFVLWVSSAISYWQATKKITSKKGAHK